MLSCCQGCPSLSCALPLPQERIVNIRKRIWAIVSKFLMRVRLYPLPLSPTGRGETLFMVKMGTITPCPFSTLGKSRQFFMAVNTSNRVCAMSLLLIKGRNIFVHIGSFFGAKSARQGKNLVVGYAAGTHASHRTFLFNDAITVTHRASYV